MGTNDLNIEAVIRKATEDVLSRVMLQHPEAGYLAQKVDGGGKVLVIVPDTLVDRVVFLDYLNGCYAGTGLTVGAYDNIERLRAGCVNSILNFRDEGIKARMAGEIKKFETVICISPGVKQMKNIAAGDDSGLIENLVVYSLIHGKQVKLLLDFCISDLPANPFTKDLSSIIACLSSMGIQIDEVCGKAKKPQDTTLDNKELVTEEKVLEIWRSGAGKIQCAKGCILTPLARDKANELGMEITYLL